MAEILDFVPYKTLGALDEYIFMPKDEAIPFLRYATVNYRAVLAEKTSLLHFEKGTGVEGRKRNSLSHHLLLQDIPDQVLR
jgi:hypothetical protein